MDTQFQPILDFIREKFPNEDFIPLHAPKFFGNERKYVLDTIDSTYVSTVGAYVTRFEQMMCKITGAKYAIATSNGTLALHLALVIAGVEHGDEVITQALTFIATANAISHANGTPVFIDVDKDTMGMSPVALRKFLVKNTEQNENGDCINKTTKKRIKACLPMHTFGFLCRIQEIKAICDEYNIILIEDCAESLGSFVGQTHTGNIGLAGTFSFNGNKTVTCGGGGAIITNDEAYAKKAKHISTTAKIEHAWEFRHDEIAYNYRMPNLNAALACAQLEQLPLFLANKRGLMLAYKAFFQKRLEYFVFETPNTTSNYWLNCILFADREERERFLKYSNENKVMTRPIWQLMNTMPMYEKCQTDDLTNSKILEERLVNLPSSFRNLI